MENKNDACFVVFLSRTYFSLFDLVLDMVTCILIQDIMLCPFICWDMKNNTKAQKVVFWGGVETALAMS